MRRKDRKCSPAAAINLTIVSVVMEISVCNAGLKFNPMDRSQFMNCYQFISVFDQLRDQNLCGIYRSAVNVMHKNNGSILNIIHDFIHCRLGIQCFPVQGIDRPQDHRCADGCFDRIIHRTVRRTYHRCTLAGEVNKLLIYPGNLGTDVF